MIPSAARRSCITLLLIASTARAGHDAAPRPFVPDPLAEGAASSTDAGWVLETPDCSVRLRLIGDAERLAYIERATGLAIDPFAAPPTSTTSFMTFVLELDNRSAGIMLFHPQRCRRVGSHGFVVPIGVDHLTATFASTGRELPEAYRRVAPVLLEGSRTLAPGESLAGLLVFAPVEPRMRAFTLEVPLTLPDGRSAALRAPYRRAPKPPQPR